MEEKQKEDKGLRVRTTPEFKLKDKVQRNFQGINLKKQFGFIPEVIIIEKVKGRNNMIVVRAVLTEEEIKKENELKEELTIGKRGENEKSVA